jgi:glucokinase
LPSLTVLAVDLGGSHAACAAVRDGQILTSRQLRADGGLDLESHLPTIKESILDCMKTASVPHNECSAFVLGFPGIVSVRARRVLATNSKFDDGPKLDLVKWCRREFGLPFLIENDARLALLGEHRFGAAKGTQDAVMITLGSGIGGAALLAGRLLQSAHGLAGAIGGHTPVALEGRLCSCGNRGCAESEASTAFLPCVYHQQAGAREGALADRKTIGFAELFCAVEAGDKPAIAALEHCFRVWSVLTVSLIHAYDPEVVVFGGAVFNRAAQILPRLQQYVNAHAWTPGRKVPLRPATLGADAALLGAAAFAEYAL